MEVGPFRQEHWRKSAQWSALVRKHAQVVADDVQIADLFSKTCRAGIDTKSGVEYTCVSDEVGATPESLTPPSASHTAWKHSQHQATEWLDNILQPCIPSMLVSTTVNSTQRAKVKGVHLGHVK